ncbi:MAG: DUF167 domain-containing protein [Egibacteraceae bacterium]
MIARLRFAPIRWHARQGLGRSRSSSTGLAGLHGGAVRLRVRLAPRDGKANAAAMETLARILGARPRDLDLVSDRV